MQFLTVVRNKYWETKAKTKQVKAGEAFAQSSYVTQTLYMLIHIFAFNSHICIFSVIFSSPFKHTYNFHSHSSLWQYAQGTCTFGSV